jgi:DNA-binding NarL/FixJ family response regulator
MVRVVLVEDNDTIRKGLESIINGSGGFTCLEVFSDCESMLKKIKDINPDILLMDINLFRKSAADGIKKAKLILPGLVILVLVIYVQNEKVFDTICAGACGYVEKNSLPSHFLNALKLAYKGGSPMSAQIAIKVQDFFLNVKDGRNKLNQSEKLLLHDLIHGNNYKAIANKHLMNIEEVQIQIRAIYKKLHSNILGID